MKSLRFKLIFMLFGSLAATIFIFFMLGSFFLEFYYTYKEKSEFVTLYNHIKKVTAENTDDVIYKLSAISANSTTTVIISDRNFTEIYSSTNIFGGMTPPSRSENMAKNYLRNFAELINMPAHAEYHTKVIDDPFSTKRLIMVAKLPHDYYLFLTKPMQSIKTSVKIYSEFLISASLIVMFFGGIAMFFVGSKLVKPIYEMVDISKRITNLDFSKKYISTGDDELNLLGECINTMSDRLSSNILALSQANIDLQNDLTQKERNEEMRKEFLQNASHELKTPISVIASYAEMLKDKIITSEDDCAYYYNVIYDETEKMGAIVRNLLGLAQLESQNRNINFEKFDITELIEDILPSFHVLLEKNELELHKNMDESVYVVADKFLTERVITNYIANACDHISGGNQIAITLKQMHDHVYFGVYNSTENKLDPDKVWVSFYKSDESNGNGLGLSIVKAIMESQNKEFGFIDKDNGVEFYIKL